MLGCIAHGVGSAFLGGLLGQVLHFSAPHRCQTGEGATSCITCLAGAAGNKQSNGTVLPFLPAVSSQTAVAGHCQAGQTGNSLSIRGPRILRMGDSEADFGVSPCLPGRVLTLL